LGLAVVGTSSPLQFTRRFVESARICYPSRRLFESITFCDPHAVRLLLNIEQA